MKLTGSLRGLLLEIASIETVQDAVNGKKVCIVDYDGDEPGGRGLREIEPVALGKSKAGNLVMRAWDREGASHTGYKGEQPLPGWRLFRLDKVLSCKPSGEVYNEPRPNYNFNGDKSMTTIITIARFDNTQQQTV